MKTLCVGLFEPSFLEPRSDPIRSDWSIPKIKPYPIRSDPVKKCFNPIRSNENFSIQPDSNPIEVSKKKGSVRSEY